MKKVQNMSWQSKTVALITSGLLASTLMIAASAPAVAATASDQASVTLELQAAQKNGLVKKGSAVYYYKNGKKVVNKMVKVGNAKYYFKSNGKAATGAYKVKGTTYVFKADGKLAVGSKTRELKVGKVTYLVTKTGKAKEGWNATKTHYYKLNGMAKNAKVKIGANEYCFNDKGDLIKGIGALKEKFCVCSDKGVYDAEASKKLNSLAKYEADWEPVREMLAELVGDPINSEDVPSCNMIGGENGKDVFYQYPGFTVNTFLSDSGKEYFMYVF